MGMLPERISKPYIVNLAAMECFTSCVLTYLNMSGFDYSRALLDYWNVGYQFRTLLSSKDARHLDPKFLHGVNIRFNKGSAAALAGYIRQGGTAILLCAASKLPYFPKSMLGMETSGFQHSVLIHGRQEETCLYAVIDPMVDYIGEIEDVLLEAAAARKGKQPELIYFSLEAPRSEASDEPTREQLFRIGSERNLRFYSQDEQNRSRAELLGTNDVRSKQSVWMEWFNNRHSGENALDGFAKDILASLDWNEAQRRSWIARNNLTIGSIMTIRPLVWQAYSGLAVMDDDQAAEGNLALEQIVKSWRTLIYKLMKYKTASTIEEPIESLLRTVERIKADEAQFLKWLYRVGEGVPHARV